MLFAAYDQARGVELWRTKGAPDGSDTELVLDIYPGTNSSGPQGMTLANGNVFFSAEDASHGRELWVTRGTTATTMLVRDIATGTASSTPVIVAATPTRVFLLADAQDGPGTNFT